MVIVKMLKKSLMKIFEEKCPNLRWDIIVFIPTTKCWLQRSSPSVDIEVCGLTWCWPRRWVRRAAGGKTQGWRGSSGACCAGLRRAASSPSWRGIILPRSRVGGGGLETSCSSQAGLATQMFSGVTLVPSLVVTLPTVGSRSLKVITMSWGRIVVLRDQWPLHCRDTSHVTCN